MQIDYYYNGAVSLTNGDPTLTVTNTGTISNSSGTAVSSIYNGTVENAGSIFGRSDGIGFGAPATIDNSGTITGGGFGIYVVNAGGISSVESVAHVHNSGVIQAASSGGSSFGAALYDGGDFVNEAGGTVTNDAFGVVVRGAYGTIDNAGTIYGRVQAVYMGATNSLLIVHPGAVFEGSVAAGAHATTSTIELASGAITGTLTGVGSEYSGFGTIVIDSGATWNIGPISTAETIQNAGTIVGGASADGILLEAGGSVINQAGGAISGEYAVGVMGGGTVENAGTMSGTNASVVFYSDAANRLIVDAGARFNGKVLGDGSQNTIELTANSGAGTLSGLGSEYVGFQTVTIDSAATWDIAGKIAAFETTAIDGFNSHDQLDLTDLTFNGADTVTLNSSNQLIIADAGGNITIQTNGVNDIARFKLLSDGHGGTVIEGLPAISQINSYQGYGSVLTNKYYLSPLTVTQAGTIHNAAGNGIASTYSWSIQNAGSIYGTANGVALAGGEVDNTGTITGGGDAVYLLGSGTVHNSGLIHDVPGYQIYGVQLHGGGDFINDASGTVTNVNFGVVVRGGSGTVDNSGTIFGRTQAVYMGAANSLLIDHAGAVFEGNVVAGASATTATIELATGSATGTLSGLGSQFTGFGTITIDPAAAWYIAGKAAAFETTAIGGLNASDQLDLTDLTFNAGDTATLNGSDQLVIADPDGNITIQLKGVAASTFSLSRDSNGGTLIEKGAQSQIIGSYGSGINLVAGTFTNPITITDTATISSSSDALGAATDWTIDNSGAISGGVGIVLGAGGSVDNEAGGTITGTGFGVYVESSSVGTVDNSGVILGAGGAGSSFGVALYGGGDFINEAGGTVTNDGFGVVVRGTYGTVDNAGTIYGGTEAVYMGATNSLLIVHPGAVFEGGVVAGAHAAISTIELKAGGSGTLSGLGAQYQGFHTVTIDSGATWDITGTMAGIGGTTIGGFNAHDRLDITDLTFASGDTVTLNSGNDVLTVLAADGTTVLDTVQLAGSFAGEFFHLADDGDNGTYITEDGTPCYCRGTLILTADGEKPVEDLKIGDRLITHWGAARPIRWIGTRAYTGRFAEGNPNILPVLIKAGALENNVPRRDLWVSPLHAMFLDDVLIPAFALVNGANVTQAAAVERVEYFHLELDSHDVIVAEGALAETFIDDDSRNMFHNAADYRALYPNATRKPAEYCAPIVEDGEMLERVRRRIAGRAGGLSRAA